MKKSILETIGNTPIVRLYGFEGRNGLKANLYAKLEFFNPFGSIKDRVAFQIIKDAKSKGLLSSEATVIEASSGNMGIALSAVGSVIGYKSIIVAPENISERRKELIRAFGGHLILTDEKKGMSGATELVKSIAEITENSYLPRQFENISGVMAHFRSTAPEMFEQIKGKIDAIVCGIGTGGTITGIANYFYGKGVKIIGVEPEKSPFLSKGQKGNHKIEGIGAGFSPEILNIKLIDEIITVSDEDAILSAKEILKCDGLFVGYSSGAVLSASQRIARREEFRDKNIVMIFADGGDRHL